MRCTKTRKGAYIDTCKSKGPIVLTWQPPMVSHCPMKCHGRSIRGNFPARQKCRGKWDPMWVRCEEKKGMGLNPEARPVAATAGVQKRGHKSRPFYPDGKNLAGRQDADSARLGG